VNAVAHIHIKPPRLTKQRFIAGGAAAIPMAGVLLLRIRHRFHDDAPQKLAIGLAFHQQAADELGGDLLGGAGKEGMGEVLEKGGGYGSGFSPKQARIEENPRQDAQASHKQSSTRSRKGAHDD